MKKIDLNVDLGEGFPHDAELLRFASSANICCGEHAGSQDISRETVALCREKGVRFGAHPGYPDRGSMGRAAMDLGHQREYLDSVFAQVRWFASEFQPAYLKPHGAFYSETAVPMPENWRREVKRLPGLGPYDAEGAFLAQYPGVQSLMMQLRIYKLPLLGLEATAHRIIAQKAGQVLIREGFADRAYAEDGTLVPRSEPGSVLSEPEAIRQQVLQLAEKVDSICLHGDTPDCVEFAELIYATLTDAGYEVGV